MFAKAILDEDVKAFVSYISNLTVKMTTHSAKKVQISMLLVKKIIILVKYLDFMEVFSKKSVKLLLK